MANYYENNYAYYPEIRSYPDYTEEMRRNPDRYGYDIYDEAQNANRMARDGWTDYARKFTEKLATGEYNYKDFLHSYTKDERALVADFKGIDYDSLMELSKDADSEVCEVAHHTYMEKVQNIEKEPKEFQLKLVSDPNTDVATLKKVMVKCEQDVVFTAMNNPNFKDKYLIEATQNDESYLVRNTARKILEDKNISVPVSKEDTIKILLNEYKELHNSRYSDKNSLYDKTNNFLQDPVFKKLLADPKKAPELLELAASVGSVRFDDVVASNPYITVKAADKLIDSYDMIEKVLPSGLRIEIKKIFEKLFDNEKFIEKIKNNPELEKKAIYTTVICESEKAQVFAAKSKYLTEENVKAFAHYLSSIETVENPRVFTCTDRIVNICDAAREALIANPKFYKILDKELTPNKGIKKLFSRNEEYKHEVIDDFARGESGVKVLVGMAETYPKLHEKMVELATNEPTTKFAAVIAENVKLTNDEYEALWKIPCPNIRGAIMERPDADALIEKYMKTETDKLEGYLAEQNAYGNDCGPVTETAKDEQNKDDKKQDDGEIGDR